MARWALASPTITSRLDLMSVKVRFPNKEMRSVPSWRRSSTMQEPGAGDGSTTIEEPINDPERRFISVVAGEWIAQART
jgi:hypothetical protein